MEHIPVLYMALGLAVVLLGGLVHGAFGVGFPLVSTPLLALMTDVQTAILLTLAPNILVNGYSMLRGGDWRASLGRFWPIALWMPLGAAVGTLWLVAVDPNPFRLLLAATMVFYLTSHHFRTLDWSWIRRHPQASGAGFGIGSGVLGGTVNVGGPVLMIFFLEMKVAPLVLVQAINLAFFVSKIAQAGTFAVLGYFGLDLLLWSLPLALISLAGLRAGMALRDRVPAERFRGWLRGLLWLMAGMLVVQFFWQLQAV